ncbi:MAG TPA: sigma 54-interacting transcriptional regulator [Polyangiaceae bacterium]
MRPPVDDTLPRSALDPTGATAPRTSHLFVLLECRRLLAGGSRHSLEGIGEIDLGRGTEREVRREGNVLVVRVPDPEMSSTHARLLRTEEGWTAKDAGSRNGTFVDTHKVESAFLADGALLELGSTLFTVRSMPTPAGTPRDLARAQEQPLATLLPDQSDSIVALLRVAVSTMSVLLLGESGTGKEVMARAIHAMSRREGAFVAVNCGALPATLVESQLFGHTKGAFSGAQRDEPGFVRASDRGTLFLDEIADLAPSSQAALLRVLQEREVVPVGGTKPIPVDLRVVSATHKDVPALVASGAFRQDLYARLAAYTQPLVPLRDRREDLGMLIAALVRKVAPERADSLRVTLDAARCLWGHDWPLNIRELENALAAAVLFAPEGKIERAHLPAGMRDIGVRSSAPPTPQRVPSSAPLSEVDEKLRADLLKVLGEHRGNVSEAARTMGKTRMQIHRWMKRFGIDPATYR